MLLSVAWLLARGGSAWRALVRKEAHLKAKQKNRTQLQVRSFKRLPRKAQPLKWQQLSLEACAALAGFSGADAYIDALEGPVCPVPLFDEEGGQELCFAPALEGLMSEARNTSLPGLRLPWRTFEGLQEAGRAICATLGKPLGGGTWRPGRL